MALQKATLRIERDDAAPGCTTLRLQGRLGFAEVTTLRRSVAPLLRVGREIDIDLAALRFLDDHGARLLCALRGRGARLSRPVGYVRELLRAMENEMSPATVRPPEPRAGRRPLPAPQAASDANLLARLRAGEEAAFEEWVRGETPRILGTVRRILRNDEDARDAAQEAFLHAFRSLHEFHGEARLSTWLHRIAINAALMQLRRRKRQPVQSIEELLPRFREDGHRVDPGPRWPARADEAFDGFELREVLQACYGRLPESYRLVLLLRDVEGLDTNETAATLGLGRDAVKMRLHRARQALRTLLEPYVLEGARDGAQVPGRIRAARRS